MRNFISEWWWAIVILAMVAGIVTMAVDGIIRSNRRESLCVQNGYADWIRIPNVGYFCYRVAGGNLVTIEFETLEKEK